MMPLRTRRLILRNWEERDRDLFHRINLDDRVMEFFPFRRNRAQSDALIDELHSHIVRDGFGFAAAEIAETGETIGFVGITPTLGLEPHVPEGAIEIGWRLAPEHWGKGYVTEASRTWLDYAFGKAGLAEIWSFAVSSNERSLAVMRRLGMKHMGRFEYPGLSGTHPELAPHELYRVTRDEWHDERT